MTKNEIFMKHTTKFKCEYIMTEPSAMAAMEEYAQQQVKNLNIPAVIKSVCEHDVRNFKDRQECEKCGEIWIRQ